MIWFGGPISGSTASLRIRGDDLDPDEITHLLECKPTKSHRKGDIEIGKSTGKRNVKKMGIWSLKAEENSTEELETKIAKLLDKVTDDLKVWKSLGQRYKLDMFCGLFMDRSNEGLSLSSSIMSRLGERSIEIGLDIYSQDVDEELERRFEAARKAPPLQ